MIYSTALSPLAVAAAEDGLRQIALQPQRRVALEQLARSTRRGLGIQVDPPEDSVPIIPVIVGEDARAVRFSQVLASAGFYVPAIRPPTVPEGTARLRISLSALHQPSMLENLLRQFQALQSGLGYA